MVKLSINCSNRGHVFRQANHVRPMIFGKLLLVATWPSISAASSFKFRFHYTGDKNEAEIDRMTIYYSENGRSRGMTEHFRNPQEDFISVKTRIPHLIDYIELFRGEKTFRPMPIPKLKPNQAANVEIMLKYHVEIVPVYHDATQQSTKPVLERPRARRCVLQ